MVWCPVSLSRLPYYGLSLSAVWVAVCPSAVVCYQVPTVMNEAISPRGVTIKTPFNAYHMNSCLGNRGHCPLDHQDCASINLSPLSYIYGHVGESSTTTNRRGPYRKHYLTHPPSDPPPSQPTHSPLHPLTHLSTHPRFASNPDSNLHKTHVSDRSCGGCCCQSC